MNESLKDHYFVFEALKVNFGQANWGFFYEIWRLKRLKLFISLLLLLRLRIHFNLSRCLVRPAFGSSHSNMDFCPAKRSSLSLKHYSQQVVSRHWSLHSQRGQIECCMKHGLGVICSERSTIAIGKELGWTGGYRSTLYSSALCFGSG